MTTTALLGIDLGTSAAKALLLAADGGSSRPLAVASRAYPSRSGGDGAHEQDPADWWEAVVGAVREALESAGSAGSAGSFGRGCAVEVAAIGLSGHMHAVVLIDGRGQVVRPAMTWADRRAAGEAAGLAANPIVERLAENPPVPAFSAPKVAWLARHEPDALAHATRLVQPKDLVRHRLTGTWGTDSTDAIGTMLYDVRRAEWAAQLWTLAGSDVRLAPPVSSSADVVGRLLAEPARELGLPAGIPVVAGAGDVSAAALGAGVAAPGTVYVNAGTAAQVMAPAATPTTPDAGGLFVFGRAHGPGFLVMSSVYAAGLSLRWLDDRVLGRGAGSEADAEVGAAGSDAGAELGTDLPPGADGLTYVPYLLGSSAPTNDEAVRATFLGLAAGHGREHLARAVAEGVAYGCAAAVEEVAGRTGGVEAIRVGGGVARSRIWREALASVFDVPVRRVDVDASSQGAALLAGVGVGVWGSVEQAAAAVTTTPVPVPDAAEVAGYRAARSRYARAERATHRFAHPNQPDRSAHPAQSDCLADPDRPVIEAPGENR